MTDRFKALIITLRHDIREDDIEPLLAAIRMLQPVLSVEPVVAGDMDDIERERAWWEIRTAILDALNKQRKP